MQKTNTSAIEALGKELVDEFLEQCDLHKIPFTEKYANDCFHCLLIMADCSNLPRTNIKHFLNNLSKLLQGNIPSYIDIHDNNSVREFLGFKLETSETSLSDSSEHVLYLDLVLCTLRQRTIASITKSFCGGGNNNPSLRFAKEQLTLLIKKGQHDEGSSIGILGTTRRSDERFHEKDWARINKEPTNLSGAMETSAATLLQVFPNSTSTVKLILLKTPTKSSNNEPMTEATRSKCLEMIESFIGVLTKSLEVQEKGGVASNCGYLRIKRTSRNQISSRLLELSYAKDDSVRNNEEDLTKQRAIDAAIVLRYGDLTKLPLQVLIFITDGLIYEFPDTYYTYSEYGGSVNGSEEIYKQMKASGACLALFGAAYTGWWWPWCRFWETCHKIPCFDAVEAMAFEMLVMFRQLFVDEPETALSSIMLVLAGDRKIEGNGENANMWLTNVACLIRAADLLNQTFGTFFDVAVKVYPDDDITQPKVIVLPNIRVKKDVTASNVSLEAWVATVPEKVEVAPGTIICIIDSGSLRKSTFEEAAQQRNNDKAAGIQRNKYEFSEDHDVEIVACAVRARAYEAFLGKIKDTDDNCCATKFVAGQLHLHCWEVMSLVLPWTRK